MCEDWKINWYLFNIIILLVLPSREREKDQYNSTI